jgi:thymidylate kinase
MNFSWCKSPDVGLPKPDLVCFLNVSEEVALARADFGGERYEKKEFQNKVPVAEFCGAVFTRCGSGFGTPPVFLI